VLGPILSFSLLPCKFQVTILWILTLESICCFVERTLYRFETPCLMKLLSVQLMFQCTGDSRRPLSTLFFPFLSFCTLSNLLFAENRV